MAKIASPTATQIPPIPFAAPFDFEALSRAGTSAVNSLMVSNAKLLEAGGAVNAELFDFVGRRLEKDAEIGETLIDCRSIDEAYEVYADFFQTSMADYLAEMQKLFAIGEGALADTAKTLQANAEAMPSPAKSAAKATPKGDASAD